MRRCRALKAAGRLLLRVEVDEIALTEVLVRMGYLHPSVADQPDAINRATEEFLAAASLKEDA